MSNIFLKVFCTLTIFSLIGTVLKTANAQTAPVQSNSPVLNPAQPGLDSNRTPTSDELFEQQQSRRELEQERWQQQQTQWQQQLDARFQQQYQQQQQQLERQQNFRLRGLPGPN